MSRAQTPRLLQHLGCSTRALSLLILMILGHSLVPVQAQDIYTCQDAKGRKLTSDRPIPECLDREQKVLNPSGTVKSRLGPALTASERAELEAKDKAEQAQKAILEEEKRRDRALLIRYPTATAHQKERLAALEQVNRSKQAAQVQVTDLQAQKAKLMDEMAFYEKDPSRAPHRLKRQLDEINQTLAAQGRFLADKDAEITRINTRFDTEQQRLAPLWQMTTATKTN